MTKSQIADVLQEIATLLELKDENPFKIRAYANAARSIETFGGNIPDLQDEEALAKIPGIGKSIAEKIKELAATGSIKYLEELRNRRRLRCRYHKIDIAHDLSSPPVTSGHIHP